MSGIMPQHNNVLTGAASIGTAATTLIAAPSIGALHVTSLQLGRTDSSTAALTVTCSDNASSVFVIDNPGTGRSLPLVFDTPLVFADKAAMTLQASAQVTTLFASAQGFLRE